MSSELTVQQASEVAQRADNAELASAYADEMGFGASIGGASFDRVRVPAGGSTTWEIPGANDEEPETTREIVGVIVDDHFLSALWLDEYTGGASAPDASWFEVAPNEIVAQISDRAAAAGALEDISVDPFNAWGSGKDGKGKAANQMYRLYVLRAGDVLPICVTVPAGSITNWTKFKRFVLTNRKRLVPEVVVSLTLKRAESGSGIPYSQIQFGLVDELSAPEAEQMLAERENLRTLTRRVPVAHDESQASPIAAVVAADDDVAVV